MKSRITRNRYAAGLALVVLAAATVQVRTDWLRSAKARAQIGDGSVKFIKDDISIHVWAIASTQRLRICTSPQSSDVPIESISLNFTEIKDQAGDVLLKKQVRVPAGEFRCDFYSFEELVAAGLDPEPTTGATPPFLVVIGTERVGLNETISVGGAQSITVGAVQSVDVATGKIELYQSFQIPGRD